MYYKKLIRYKKLIKFWIFFGNNFKNIFKINFETLNILYNKNCFLDFQTLILNIKIIFPLFLNIFKSKGTILFISTKFFYYQTIFKKYYFSIIKKLLNVKSIGIFTNFSVLSHRIFKNLDFKFNPSVIFFFYLKKNIFLLIESKKKNIPTISLLTADLNSSLIEYPLFVNSLYFYTIYFFNKFFFKLIFLNK